MLECDDQLLQFLQNLDFLGVQVMYKKIAPDPTGSVDAVYLYYWDDPEDPEKLDQGWWFSNAVGGELVPGWIPHLNPSWLEFKQQQPKNT